MPAFEPIDPHREQADVVPVADRVDALVWAFTDLLVEQMGNEGIYEWTRRQAEALVKTKRGLIGKRIVTESGESLGDVGDYEFAPDTFALTNLFVFSSRMNLRGKYLTIAADQVRAIGRDTVIVTGDNAMQSDAEVDAETKVAAEKAKPEPEK